MITHWAAAYVGIPYAEDGRTGGLHCWSLCKRVLEERAGILVPSYGEISATDLTAIAGLVKGHNVELWQAIPKEWAGEFDLVLMAGRVKANGRSHSAPVHIGIMADHRHVLHVEEATATALVPIDHPTVRFRLLSIHRHRSLC